MWQYNKTEELYHGYNNFYTNTDELYHYGVLGMKWRIRRLNQAKSAYEKANNKYRKSTSNGTMTLKDYAKLSKRKQNKIDKANNKNTKSYNKYEKLFRKTENSFKKNNMKLGYDFDKDKYYGYKEIKR